jgi:hypothetical protein
MADKASVQTFEWANNPMLNQPIQITRKRAFRFVMSVSEISRQKSQDVAAVAQMVEQRPRTCARRASVTRPFELMGHLTVTSVTVIVTKSDFCYTCLRTQLGQAFELI